MVLHNFSLLIHKLIPTSPFLKERSLSCIGPHYNWRITGIQELFIHSVDKDILNQNQKMANCISTASRNLTTKNNVSGPQKRSCFVPLSRLQITQYVLPCCLMMFLGFTLFSSLIAFHVHFTMMSCQQSKDDVQEPFLNHFGVKTSASANPHFSSHHQIILIIVFGFLGVEQILLI